MQVRAQRQKRKLLLERILDFVEPQHKIARLILLNNSLESRCVRGCAEDLIKRQTSETDHVAESWFLRLVPRGFPAAGTYDSSKPAEVPDSSILFAAAALQASASLALGTSRFPGSWFLPLDQGR